MCGQHNIRASTEDNTGQNTKDTHPIPGQELKFLTPPGIEPGPPGWKAGTLPTTPRRQIRLYLLQLLLLLLHLLLLLLLLLLLHLPSQNLGLTPPGTYNPNVRGSDACRGSNSLWTDTQGRASLNVWSAQYQSHRHRQHMRNHKGYTAMSQDRN